jgi:hypothetical protein
VALLASPARARRAVHIFPTQKTPDAFHAKLLLLWMKIEIFIVPKPNSSAER